MMILILIVCVVLGYGLGVYHTNQYVYKKARDGKLLVDDSGLHIVK